MSNIEIDVLLAQRVSVVSIIKENYHLIIYIDVEEAEEDIVDVDGKVLEVLHLSIRVENVEIMDNGY